MGLKEEWKPIVGFEDFAGLYEVSNLGRVRSVPRYHSKEYFILSPTKNKRDGRLSVMLSNRGSYKRVCVHRLVGFAFVENPKPNEYKELNHKDENPANNLATNLEWCDRKYNMNYNGLQFRMHDKIKTPVVGVDKEGNTVSYESQQQAIKDGYYVSHYLGTGKEYKGYVWNYGRKEEKR